MALCRNKIDTLILLIVGIFINVAHYLQIHGFYITFFDPDDYMRLVKIKDFFDNRELSNTIISRCNVPQGCDLHWTRFYDFFIIIPVYIINFFTNSIDKSIEYVGFFISPIVKSATIAIIFSLFQKLMTKNNAFLLTVIFAVHPLILPLGMFGRPDHHAFIMLFIVIYLHSIATVIESKLANIISIIKAALTTILCVWISPETLIPLLLTDGILFLYSFSDIEKLKKLYLKNIFIASGIGVIVFFQSYYGFCIAIFVMLTAAPYSSFHKNIEDPILKNLHIAIIMLIAVLFPQISHAEYDKISAQHMELYLLSAVYFGISMMTSSGQKYKTMILRYNKYLLSIFWFVIIAAVFLFMYPKFFYGMGAEIDAYAKLIWLNKVAEMQSPLACGDCVFFITYSAITLIAVINKITKLAHKNFDVIDLMWWILIANTVCYMIFAGMAYRMLPYSVLFGLPIIVDFGMNSKFTNPLHKLWRIVITFFISVFFLFCTAYFSEVNETQDKVLYTQKELFDVIDNLSSKPIVIMAHSNDGPEILYYTKHSVVGAPYHRQTQGIIFSYKTIEAKYDEASIKSILKATNSSYIFVRKSKYKTSKINSLSKMIADNNLPKWIDIVKLPEKFNNIIIAKINKSQI